MARFWSASLVLWCLLVGAAEARVAVYGTFQGTTNGIRIWADSSACRDVLDGIAKHNTSPNFMMLPGGCLHDPVQSGDFVLLYLYRYDANGGINTGLVTTEFVYFTVGAEANWLQEADSVNLFNLSIDSGNQIALAIGAVWALAFGIKVVARVFHDGKSTEEE